MSLSKGPFMSLVEARVEKPRPGIPIKIIVAMQRLSDQYGDRVDCGRLLDVMAAAAPGRPEIAAAQALNLIKLKSYAEARSMLEQVERQHPRNTVIKALLAMCLYMQGDGLWVNYAEESFQLPADAVARSLAEGLAKRAGVILHVPDTPAEPFDNSYPLVGGLAC